MLGELEEHKGSNSGNKFLRLETSWWVVEVGVCNDGEWRLVWAVVEEREEQLSFGEGVDGSLTNGNG